MVAFQNPITYQGSVTANIVTRTRSTASKPPGESATTASQISPAMVRPTSEKNRICRGAREAEGAKAVTWAGMVRSSMRLAFTGLFWQLKDIAAGRARIQTPPEPGLNVTENQAPEERALWYVGPGQAELRPERLGALAPGKAR